VDVIVVTIGPGLITSLQVGIETAKTLAFVWNLPVIAVNHIEAHIYANFINENSKLQSRVLGTKSKQIPNYNPEYSGQNPKIEFPAIILTVSGGHTMLALMHGHGRFETIGETRDDAAGEAFDKAASMLGLGYPGGPAIAHRASQIAHRKTHNTKPKRYALHDTRYAISLPRPMIKDKSFDFSFSGLKTALRYQLEKDRSWEKRIPEYAAEFQEAVTDVLVYKTIKAAKKYGVKNVMLAGGVSANHRLREKMTAVVKQELPSIQLNIPDLKYTTDNAAMVAAAGYFKALRKNFTPWQKLWVDCNAKL
jgi:N6-L-threonylcarbamoyladenine synthase